MTDRELLELAAKASGELTPSWYGNAAYFDGVLQRWNPLTDDGDAFRLAAKLFMEVRFLNGAAWAEPANGCNGPFHEFEGESHAAARRAIVRAAAEIGKGML